MWPEYFPEKCPPENSRSEAHEVYRLVNGSTAVANDFLPTVVEAPHRPFPADMRCMACGVSVFGDVADAIKTRAKFKALKFKHIAKGTITPSDGVILETGAPTHMTWWLKTPTPHANFSEVLPNVAN